MVSSDGACIGLLRGSGGDAPSAVVGRLLIVIGFAGDGGSGC